MTDTAIPIGTTRMYLRGVDRGGTTGIDEYVVQADALSGLSALGAQSVYNNTTTPLTGGATYTGTWERTSHQDAFIVCKTDQSGMMYFELSPDGVNVDASIAVTVSAGVNEAHTILKGPRYFRVRFVNDSVAQSYIRLYSYFGTYRQLNSALNSSIQSDADAITARVIGEESLTAEGRYLDRSIVNKFGRNADIDTGSVPEDIWNGGGVYAGFPTGSPEEFQVFSSNAGDTGQLTFTYLASNTSTEYQTATVTLQGTTPVNTGVTGYRMHAAQYSSGSATAFNLGEITVRHRTTTANIFCKMPVGRSQTNTGVYTVPAGYTAYIRRIFCRVIGAVNGTVDGSMWIRTLNGSPRLRKPFSAAIGAPFEERPYGGLTASAGSDITVRISATTATLDVIAGFDIVLVKN